MAKFKIGKAKARPRAKVNGMRKTRKRRRSIGGVDGIMGMAKDALAVTAGAVGGREIAILAGQMIPSLQANPMWVGLGQVGIGLFLVKEGKGGFLSKVGWGLVGNGGTTAIVATHIIAGPPATYMFNRKTMGDPRLQYVAGPQTRIGSVYTGFPQVAGPANRKRRSFAY